MFDPKHITLYQELLKEAEDKVALDPSMVNKLLIGGGIAGGALGLGAYGYGLHKMHEKREADRIRARNHAFGAGVAAGVAGPRVIRGLYSIAQRNGLFPQSEMPQ